MIPFDSEEWDTDAYHSTSSNTSRITIPAGRGGKYLLQAGTFVNGAARLEFHVNGSTDAVHSSGGTLTAAGYTTLSAMVELAAGDYVELLGIAGAARTYGDNTEAGAKSSFVATLMGGALDRTNEATGRFAIAPLDRTTAEGIDATFGDDFDGASLNGRWTRVNQTSGEESYRLGPRASALGVAYTTATVSRYIYQAAPAGDWTFEASYSVYQPTSTGQMFGILALDASSNGIATFMYDNSPGFALGSVVGGAYGSAYANLTTYTFDHRGGLRIWVRLRKVGGTYYGAYSLDGEAYGPEISGTPSAFTLARIGFGRFLGTVTGDTIYMHWFDRTA